MALDTVVLRSPYISEDNAVKIERSCIRREGVDLSSGEVLYQITTGMLSGSWDSRISIRVERERWEQDLRLRRPGETAPVVKVSTPPYLRLEGSVHKALLGHNIHGGPVGFQESVAWFIDTISSLVDVQLPDFRSCEVRRADIAEVYDLGSFEAVEEYFRGHRGVDYPRRELHAYGHNGLFAQGLTTAVKLYHKGVEFSKHDRKKLRKLLSASELFELQEYANRILRCEVEIKSHKLDYDFGHSPTVSEVSNAYLEGKHDTEMFRLLREGVHDMKQVRTAHAVRDRLFDLYNARLAGLLFGTWLQLSALGEETIKNKMQRASFYRHRKMIIDAGCSWHSTDVVLKNFSLVPQDFSPVRSDPRRLSIEAPLVSEKLSSYRVVS